MTLNSDRHPSRGYDQDDVIDDHEQDIVDGEYIDDNRRRPQRPNYQRTRGTPIHDDEAEQYLDRPLATRCLPDEVLHRCGHQCDPTCNASQLKCPDHCSTPGCVCKPGFLRNNDSNCVPESLCFLRKQTLKFRVTFVSCLRNFILLRFRIGTFSQIMPLVRVLRKQTGAITSASWHAWTCSKASTLCVRPTEDAEHLPACARRAWRAPSTPTCASSSTLVSSHGAIT